MEIVQTHVLVTGGSSGIGKETAKALIEKGAKVVITGRDETKLRSVATELGAFPLVFDIGNLESIPSKVEEVMEFLDGRIDILVNNAGLGSFPLLGEITEETLFKVYKTNVFGLILLTQELLPFFKKQKGGDIVNIGSTASSRGFAKGSVYASSKFAVKGITQSWQAELRKDNIRVTLINPSEVTTAFGNVDRIERVEELNKLAPKDIAHVILSVLEMDKRGFVPEVSIWATNPF